MDPNESSSASQSDSAEERPGGRQRGGHESEAGQDASKSNTNSEGQVDSESVITDNAPLDDTDFPINAPPSPGSSRSQAPRLLRTLADLHQVTLESLSATNFSNYATISTPANRARPSLTALKRFASTQFARGEFAEKTVIAATNPDSGALYDLAFPVNLFLTDGQGLSLPRFPTAIPDSKGYPLLYNFESAAKLVRARTSAALYPVNISRGLKSKLSGPLEPAVLRAWTRMFRLSDDAEAQNILQHRVMGAEAGDNHIALLFKAYMAYFDSAVGALDGTEPAHEALSSAGVVVNITQQPSWTSHVLSSGAEIVNVLGHAVGYQQFWAYCCFMRPPVYATKSAAGGLAARSQFSNYRLDGAAMSMMCLCDEDVYSTDEAPTFFGHPELILGYIETYVQTFGLQEQANEALQIATLWPSLLLADADVSLPAPLHTADWLGADVEKPQLATAYPELVACGSFVALASTLASAWALQSQLYDLVTLAMAGRRDYVPSPREIDTAIKWLTTNISAPGVGWHFIFGPHATSSFLFLTGLSVQLVTWARVFAPIRWREQQFPAHLRLIQPYWTETSVCCTLPWEAPWKPELGLAGNAVDATPGTVMRMLRLGLLDPSPDGAERAANSEGIVPIPEGSGRVTIAINDACNELLQIILRNGVRVVALSSPTVNKAADPFTVLLRDHPSDAQKMHKLWSVGAK